MTQKTYGPERVVDAVEDHVEIKRRSTNERIMNVVDGTGKIIVGTAGVIGYGVGATLKTGIKATQGLIRGLAA